ncbi:hypothetical protein ACFX2G_009551 [Malus domestica]
MGEESNGLAPPCNRINHDNLESEPWIFGDVGVGERRKAGVVRGSAPQASLNQGQVPRPTPYGGNVTRSQGYKVKVTSSGRDKKKWRRLQRLQVSSNPFQWVVPQGWEYPMWELGVSRKWQI